MKWGQVLEWPVICKSQILCIPNESGNALCFQQHTNHLVRFEVCLKTEILGKHEFNSWIEGKDTPYMSSAILCTSLI